MSSNFEYKDQLLNRQQAADFLGVTVGTLAVWHCQKRYNIPAVKIGKLVKYRIGDLISFVESNTVNKF